MTKINKRFQRAEPTKLYRKVFYIFSEGESTEPLYFEMLKKQCFEVHINLRHSRKRTSAKQILNTILEFIRNEKPGKHSETWAVLDADKNSKNDLEKLKTWSKKPRRGLALSNPKFEYWLLLHFDKGDKIHGEKICEIRLKKHLPNYNKNNLDAKKLWLTKEVAILNAKNKHSQCKDWYRDNHTTVFELVEKILKIEKRL